MCRCPAFPAGRNLGCKLVEPSDSPYPRGLNLRWGQQESARKWGRHRAGGWLAFLSLGAASSLWGHRCWLSSITCIPSLCLQLPHAGGWAGLAGPSPGEETSTHLCPEPHGW